EGCKDSSIITRMPGSRISSGGDKEKTVEGEYHTWEYVPREGVSAVQVLRNAEAVLKKGGFVVDYQDPPTDLTAHKGNVWYTLESKGSYYNQTIVTVKGLEQEVTAESGAQVAGRGAHRQSRRRRRESDFV